MIFNNVSTMTIPEGKVTQIQIGNQIQIIKPYIELDYIESTGTQNNEMQYINTGFKPNQDTKIVMDVQGTQSGTLGRFYYGVDNSSTERFMFGKGSGSSWNMYCYYKNTNINIGTWNESVFKQRKTIIHDKNKFIIDGVEYSTTYTTFQLPYNMYLFCDNYQGEASNYCSMRLFSCQIYDNGTLIRDYIPVQMRKTGEIGLWDKVNKMFYANAGVGKFIGVKNSLPVNGTPLTCIQSTGIQYIDTGFKPKHNSRVVMDISGLPNVARMIFGTRNMKSTTASEQFNLYRESATTLRSDYFGTNKIVSLLDSTVRTTIDKNANVLTAYGLTITNTAVSNKTCSYPMFLFALNDCGSASGTFASYKLYSCQIYDNETLVRDYIPFKMPDDSIGLWDKVNCEFYPNAGTGEFIAGEIAA